MYNPVTAAQVQETCFDTDLVLPSGLIHISAVTGPLVIWRVRFSLSVSEVMSGDSGGGDKERSRMNCPFTGAPRFDMRR
jgi:hypothetical protein